MRIFLGSEARFDMSCCPPVSPFLHQHDAVTLFSYPVHKDTDIFRAIRVAPSVSDAIYFDMLVFCVKWLEARDATKASSATLSVRLIHCSTVSTFPILSYSVRTLNIMTHLYVVKSILFLLILLVVWVHMRSIAYKTLERVEVTPPNPNDENGWNTNRNGQSYEMLPKSLWNKSSLPIPPNRQRCCESIERAISYGFPEINISIRGMTRCIGTIFDFIPMLPQMV